MVLRGWVVVVWDQSAVDASIKDIAERVKSEPDRNLSAVRWSPTHAKFGAAPKRPQRAFGCDRRHILDNAGGYHAAAGRADCLAGGFCGALGVQPVNFAKERLMPKTIEHVHWPDAPDLWMPYAPAIKVRGGTTVYLAGVTAAPVYHHHPHRPEEFDAMPSDMEGRRGRRSTISNAA